MVTDAVLTVKRPGKPLDVLMIEQMEMVTKDALDSRLVKGLVLDHGARHPDMPKSLTNCYVLILNVSLEYEKSETNASFVYSTAQERDELVAAERKFTDDKVRKIIDFKNELCPPDSDRSFVVINQKGIDPLSLDMLAKASFPPFFGIPDRHPRSATRQATQHGATLPRLRRHPHEQRGRPLPRGSGLRGARVRADGGRRQVLLRRGRAQPLLLHAAAPGTQPAGRGAAEGRGARRNPGREGRGGGKK